MKASATREPTDVKRRRIKLFFWATWHPGFVNFLKKFYHRSRISGRLNLKALFSFENCGFNYEVKRRHIPEKLSPQTQRYENVQTRQTGIILEQGSVITNKES